MGGCTVKGVGENAFSQTWTEASNRLKADVTAVQQTRAGGGGTCHAGVWTHGKPGLSQWFHAVLNTSVIFKRHSPCEFMII
jgi:hypothetical protein